MRGRKPYIPTEEHRKMVQSLTGLGITEDDICKMINNPQTGNPISPKTLRKHYRNELDTGNIVVNSKVAQSLYKKATGDGIGSVAAAIFWLKVRAGWKEKREELDRPSDLLNDPDPDV
ncbi:MAG: hypothetical protein KGI54_16035 [Pseudomonadota bacterium]|nr:hypothetical protein [Pseudomonadota bacterium]